MDHPKSEILHRLGPNGLKRALDDLLDQNQLVRLATTCGLKYPGMRTKTQGRKRLLSDLVDRATTHDEAGKAILRLLKKETGPATREWNELNRDEKAQRLLDEEFLRADHNLGLHLYLVACAGEGSGLDGFGTLLAHRHLLRLASNGVSSKPAASSASREETRLRKTVHGLEKKVKHLETQLTKSRDSERTSKRDLMERKGELAESRMLVERLRRELAEAQALATLADAGKSSGPSADKPMADLTRAVRKLASEQKSLVHKIDKVAVAPASPKSRRETKTSSLTTGVKQLQSELGAFREAIEHELTAQGKGLEALRSDLRAREAVARGGAAKTSKRTPRKGQAERVGVFIDVQNMYYSARQLKGKLDFDALLQAAVAGRRLIEATAYVVESKEIDQSQFIAMLQQRGIEVRRKPLRVRADGSMKGDWDMELALDILDAVPRLDLVVLVSGDGDFTSLVQRVKAMGPRVEVIAFPRNTAKSLQGAADLFQALDRKFMIYSRTKVARAKARAEPTPDKSPRKAAADKPRAAATGSDRGASTPREKAKA